MIGPDAVEARLGGYSRPGGREVSLLDAIRERAAATGTTVRYAEGCGRVEPKRLGVIGPDHLRPSSVKASGVRQEIGGGANERGLRGEYFANPDLAGEPASRRVDPKVDFHWTFLPPAPGLATDWYSVRWTGSLLGPESGPRRIGIEGNDGFRLWLDGRLIIDRWRKGSYRTAAAEVRLEKGQAYDLRLEFHEPVRSGEVRLVWDYGPKDESRKRIEEAIELARTSDLAVVAVGIEEGEGRDRSDIRLPGRQAEMIRLVAAAGAPAVVLIYGGSAVDMTDWIDAADAVLMAWYPGEEGGRAVADVLWGEADPSGRLPITFPRSAGQLPLVYDHKPTGRLDDYLDLTGEPLFPFGYGLSYTDFRYTDLSIAPGTIAPGRNGPRFAQDRERRPGRRGRSRPALRPRPAGHGRTAGRRAQGIPEGLPGTGSLRDRDVRPGPGCPRPSRRGHARDGRAGRVPDLRRELLPRHPPQRDPDGKIKKGSNLYFL